MKIELTKSEAELLARFLKKRIKQSEEIFRPVQKYQRSGSVIIETEPHSKYDKEWNERCVKAEATRQQLRGILAKVQ